MVKGRGIVPLADLGVRPPEAGRIRMGVKSGKAMKSIDTLRFTSPREDLIVELARQFGGECKPWHDDLASPRDQFQVTTNAKQIPVWVIAGGLSTTYEMWAGGGNLRRCDGVLCETPVAAEDGDYELRSVPCICVRNNVAECKPYTRLQVIIPSLAFAGVWRLESKGWNAAQELAGVFQMIEALQGGGFLPASLGIEKRERMIAGRRKNFVVPRLSIEMTAADLALGGGTVTQLALSSGERADQLAIGSGGEMFDNGSVEAELVDDELLEIERILAADAANFGLDEQRYVDAVKHQCRQVPDGEEEDETHARARMRRCSEMVRGNRLRPTGFQGGKIAWLKL